MTATSILLTVKEWECTDNGLAEGDTALDLLFVRWVGDEVRSGRDDDENGNENACAI